VSYLGVKHFRLVQLVITLGLILSIVGGTSGNTSPGSGIQVSTASKAGIILYICAYAALCLVCVLSITSLHHAESGEKRLAFAVILALPFILVRLIYSTLVVFVHNHDFNIVGGSVVLLVVMAVVDEFIVVGIYLVCGFTMEKQSPDVVGPLVSRPWKSRS
jgi:uncharacterized membrane protein (DUF485 family)